MSTKKLIGLILRHGESSANAEHVFRSRLDPPLTEKGQKQAHAAAEFLAKSKVNIRHITSSPLLRAMQTADIVADKLELKVKQDRGLLCWNLGFLSGKPRDVYGPILEFFVDHPELEPPEGESLEYFTSRTQDFFEKHLGKSANEAASGDPITGYAEEGPYHCEDCIHKPSKDSPHCIHPKLVSNPRLSDRLVQIDGVDAIKIDLKKGCCEYVRPKAVAEDSVPLFVCHTSNLVCLENLIVENPQGRPESGEAATSTGGIAALYIDGEDLSVVPVFGSAHAAEFGS